MAIQKTESALVKKVWDIANVLSAAGVGFTDYITQLTYILFLKMDEEKEEMGLESTIPEGCKWSDLAGLSGDDLSVKYEEILKELSKDTGLIGTIFTKATNKIDRPVYLKKVIDMVAEENWYMMEGDLKGAIYEGILEKNGQDAKSGAGQYFTPRALIQAIVDVVDPKITETVADPCCGTAGFLLAAYENMRKQSKEAEKQKFLKNHGFTEGYTIKEVSEEQDAGINFFLTIVLPIIIDDLDKWQNSLTFVLIMIITIILLSKTNLYYANPVLMIFGYRVIRFKFETPPPNMNDDEYIGICPKKINASHSIKFKRIDDNVLCIKQRERRQNDNRRISPENQ